MNGLLAARGIREQSPGTAVVALTRHTDPAYVKELMAAGASGYVLKQSASSELLKAIRAAAHGGTHLDASLATRSVAGILSRGGDQSGPLITGRERQVLQLMALGHSNKDIASALDVAVKTVEVHKSNAMRKLGLSGRIDVIRYASLQGWLSEP
jgi:DNA-binding NarL/FixJ family response regulator